MNPADRNVGGIFYQGVNASFAELLNLIYQRGRQV